MKPIPGWLQPYKNEWRSESKMRDLMATNRMAFTTFFAIIKPRLKSVTVPYVGKLAEAINSIGRKVA